MSSYVDQKCMRYFGNGGFVFLVYIASHKYDESFDDDHYNIFAW